MVKPQSSKLMTRVRFPSSPRYIQNALVLRTGAFSLYRGSEAEIADGHGFGASFARNLYLSARHPLAGIKTLSVFALGCFTERLKRGSLTGF